jgi:N-dimethylarginine dimethylaminohydrolase
MKIEFGAFESAAPLVFGLEKLRAHILGEADRLTDVILCPPHHLAPVPCCAVTRTKVKQGFTTHTEAALQQHARLVNALQDQGVRCHMLPPSPELPDMCFTRDIGVSTPWGMVVLNPAMPHRQGEVDALLTACQRWDIPVRRISRGTIEGGDICIAREGLLILGISGERTSLAGVEEFAAPFRLAGWDVLVCPFHADHLHLDTIFCMVNENEAIACVDLLDADFRRALTMHGISVLPMPSSLVSTLGCNILALGEKRILAAATDDVVASTLGEAGYIVQRLDISQFAACGGGIHCLTQPLRRLAA